MSCGRRKSSFQENLRIEQNTSARSLLYGKHGNCAKEGCQYKSYSDKAFCWKHSGTCLDCKGACHPKSARCARCGALHGQELRRLNPKAPSLQTKPHSPKGRDQEVKWLLQAYNEAELETIGTDKYELVKLRGDAMREQMEGL